MSAEEERCPCCGDSMTDHCPDCGDYECAEHPQPEEDK